MVEKDTIVFVQPPLERSEAILPTDSISVLETSLATSTAEIRGGMLRHSIENKKDSIKVVTKVVTKEKEVEKEVPVEVEKIVPVVPKWAYWTLGLTLILILWVIVKLWRLFAHF